MARIEFYVGSSPKFIAVIEDGAVPRRDEWINIHGVTYRVARVTWAIDSNNSDPRMRANVEMIKREPQ